MVHKGNVPAAETEENAGHIALNVNDKCTAVKVLFGQNHGINTGLHGVPIQSNGFALQPAGDIVCSRFLRAVLVGKDFLFLSDSEYKFDKNQMFGAASSPIIIGHRRHIRVCLPHKGNASSECGRTFILVIQGNFQ